MSTGYESICKPCSAEKARAWRAVNKQSRNYIGDWAEMSQRQRARRLEVTETNLVPGWRKILLDYYGYRCLKCGSLERIEADHVVPISKGGPHTIENFQTLCKFCNISKLDKVADYRNGDVLTESEMLSRKSRKTQKAPDPKNGGLGPRDSDI